MLSTVILCVTLAAGSEDSSWAHDDAQITTGQTAGLIFGGAFSWGSLGAGVGLAAAFPQRVQPNGDATLAAAITTGALVGIGLGALLGWRGATGDRAAAVLAFLPLALEVVAGGVAAWALSQARY